MPSRRTEIRSRGDRFALLRSAVWSHRWGALFWALAAGIFVLYFGIAYRAQILSFKGGAAAFGLAATPIAEAMRPLSGPADRLDTYGGYVTYHNTSVIAILLSLWAVIQGARAIRGWEERGGLEVWSATGRRRSTLVRDQWLGFIAALAIIVVGYGLGLGAGAQAADASNWSGAFIVAGETAIVALLFFGLGLLVSQLTLTARAAAGITTLGMVFVYVLGNMAGELGLFSWIRFLSPFFYFQQSRVLIPGHSVDALATLVLMVGALTLVVIAAAVFARRDLGASALAPIRFIPAQKTSHVARHVRVGGFWHRSPWLHGLWEQRGSLLIWIGASGLMMGLMVGAINSVTAVWRDSDLIRQLFGRVPGQTYAEQYMAYVGIVAAVTPAAYAVTQASRWVSDLEEGRAATLVSISGSRVRLVLDWAAAALVGIAAVSVAVLAGSAIGAFATDTSLSTEGILRTAAVGTLLGAGIAGVALGVVVLFKSVVAVGALAAWLGIGFFVSLLGPMFNWPDWLMRLSPFDAFGTPYTGLPRTSGLLLLAGLAICGTIAAAVIGQRRSALV